MKRIIRKFLNLFGYDLMKVFHPSLFRKEHFIQVAGNKIAIPTNNPLRKTYTEQPDFGMEIGRISKSVAKKYHNFAIVDVGANIGDSAITIRSQVENPIISIEGDEHSFSYLERNTKNIPNITTIKKYLGEKNTSIKVKIDKGGWNNTLIPGTENSQEVQLSTLDTILSEINTITDPIKFIKIDTEGFDTIILRGSENTLKKYKPVIYLEFNQDNMRAIGEDGISTVMSLKNLGYSLIMFYDDRGKLILSTNLDDREILSQLFNYADGKKGLIYYYNLCILATEDSDIMSSIQKLEA